MFVESVTSGNDDSPSGLFDSGTHGAPFTFSFTFPSVGTFPYYSRSAVLFMESLTGLVRVIASSGLPAMLDNISTRLLVGTNNDVLIGGFIVTGTQPKKVIVRAIGPSLPVEGKLADPTLELHMPDGSFFSNDNWRETQEAEIIASTVPPQNDLESAIVATLASGNYTAIVSGKNQTSGVGLVEAYDLNLEAGSKLANISTRGSVDVGNNVMIGGFILGGGTGNANVLVRALGPSLTQAGVAGALADPTLELRDGNGVLLMGNDNWKETQQTQIEATGIPPTNEREAAVVANLPPGLFTAIVAGKSNTTGVALVEVYQLP